MVSKIVVLAVRAAETPLTVILYAPGTEVADGVKVNVLADVVDEELNAAATPRGTPATERTTAFARFSGFTTVMVVDTAAPPNSTDRALFEDASVKLGAGTVRRMFTADVAEPEVPLTWTV